MNHYKNDKGYLRVVDEDGRIFTYITGIGFKEIGDI
jgi:hypothetical protein